MRLLVSAGFAALLTSAIVSGPVATGRHFEIFVTKVEEKPMAPGYTMNVYQVEAVARTRTHGTQRIRRRVETTNSNLLDNASWEIVDFDHDSWDDYRYLAGITKSGCRTWEAERWEPDHDWFTSAPKYTKWTNAQNQPVAGTCIGK